LGVKGSSSGSVVGSGGSVVDGGGSIVDVGGGGSIFVVDNIVVVGGIVGFGQHIVGTTKRRARMAKVFMAKELVKNLFL
jgi:hypothetical protein